MASMTSVFSQEMHLSVDNKPLNTVLGMLGIEISFNDKALSAYNVSVSKAFKNPEDALFYLLKNKPFKVEKINHVFIIVPTEANMNRNNTIAVSAEDKTKIVFTGEVFDEETIETLWYATVCLYNSDNRLLAAGATNEKGTFRLTTSQLPKKIKISFIGYETIIKDIPASNASNVELGLFLLQSSAILLEETVVTGYKDRHAVDRVSYAVTSTMSDGVANAEELLDKIPGIYLDRTSNTIKVNNSEDILLLVDGIQQPEDYIKNLSPRRIHSIEVIRESSGRYVSDGYTAIINLILKKDYRGYDIYASNFSGFNFTNKNPMALERPVVGMTYTNDRINVHTSYSYEKENQNLSVSKELIYNGIKLISGDIPQDINNDSYKHEKNTITSGFNYNINQNQIIGIQGEYISGKSNEHPIYTMRRLGIEQSESQDVHKNTTENITSINTFDGILFYQGRINNNLQLYSDFSYNYYYNDIDNRYNLIDFRNYETGNIYNEYKNHTLFNVDMQYLLSSQASINMGYSNAWRKYGSGSSHGRGFLDYREFRNKAFAYIIINSSKKFQAKSGVAIEHTRSYDRDTENSYFRILPYAQVNYNISKIININAAYSTNQNYPLLYQLSPMSMVIDTFLTQMGNPKLKSAIRHSVSLNASLWNRLTITPMFNYTNDKISELFIENIDNNYKLYRTFNNIDTREYAVQMTYNQPLGACFSLKNIAAYYYGEALNTEIKNTSKGWLINSEISYYHANNSFGMKLGYHRNMRSHILSQGYMMSGKDNWLITANKDFWKNRISVMLSYIPPVSLGVRYNRTRILETSFYEEKTNHNLESYNNMLLLKVGIRFDRGNSKTVGRRSTIKKDEREKQTIEF